MSILRVIDALQITHEGPQARGPAEETQPVFLQQGAIDGACGPYSLLMALLICGVIDVRQLTHWWYIDRRTHAGKLVARLEQHPGLFRQGTHLSDLGDILSGIFTKQLCYDISEAAGVDIRAFVCQHIIQGHPVILGLGFSSGAHWVVVVGIAYDDLFSEAAQEPKQFLVLDPGGSPPTVSAWNTVMDAKGSGGKYPYHWWSHDEKVMFEHAIALWPQT